MDEDKSAECGKPKYRSREKVAWSFTFAAAAYNPIRLLLMAQRA